MKKANLLFICFSLFLFSQLIYVFEVSNNVFQPVKLKDLLDGSYSKMLEKNFSKNLPIFTKTGVYYRLAKLERLGLYSRNVQILDSGRVILRSRMDEISPDDISKADNALGKIVFFRDELSKLGIKLLVVLVPNRSYVYRKQIYSNGEVPPNRKILLNDFEQKLILKKINLLQLHDIFDVQEDEVKESLYFKGDHHWTYLASELASREIYSNAVSLFRIESALGHRDIQWESQKSTRSSLSNKLGLLKKLPEIFHDKIDKPIFEESKNEENSEIYFISASYGEFNVADFISSQFDLKISKRVHRGKGATYVISNFIQELSHEPQNKKHMKGVIWMFPEYHILSDLSSEYQVPSLVDISKYKKVKFLLQGEGNPSSDTIMSESGDFNFSVELSRSIEDFILDIEILNNYQQSIIRCVETNESYVLSVKPAKNKLKFNLKKKLLNKVTFQIKNYGGQVSRQSTVLVNGIYSDAF